MAMYTEMYINVDLKIDEKHKEFEIIKKIVEHDFSYLENNGFPATWGQLFCSMSFYTPNTDCALLTYSEVGGWSLLGKGDIENYNKDIEKFFSWIRPFVDGSEGDFIGYIRYEDNSEPRLIYL